MAEPPIVRARADTASGTATANLLPHIHLRQPVLYQSLADTRSRASVSHVLTRWAAWPRGIRWLFGCVASPSRPAPNVLLSGIQR
jgi:hypothetical protein